MGMECEIAVDDPRAEDVRALLEIHLAFSRGVTPAEYSFALDVEQLLDPAVTFFSARQNGALLGVVALKRLAVFHAELKSMHVREAARGRGVGRAIVERVLAVAGQDGYRQVSLETGTMDEFASARALYAKAGFRLCEPFGDYTASSYNTCMTISLDPVPGPARG